MNNPQYIVVHHSLTDDDFGVLQSEGSFNSTHKARGFQKSQLGWHIGYHYVIYGNGEVRQYRRDDEEGAHTKERSMNYKSLGICLAGNFDIGKDIPKPEQFKALHRLLDKLQETYRIPNHKVHPHRYYAPYKSCWGNLLPDQVKKYLRDNFPYSQDDASEFAKEAQAWAMKNGISNGQNPKGNLTREEAWVSLLAYHKKFHE